MVSAAMKLDIGELAFSGGVLDGDNSEFIGIRIDGVIHQVWISGDDVLADVFEILTPPGVWELRKDLDAIQDRGRTRSAAEGLRD